MATMVMRSRRQVAMLVVLLLAFLAVASGKRSLGKGPKRMHSSNSRSRSHTGVDAKPSGNNDFVNGTIDFDALSPMDCASYLCVSSPSLASEYIESGCPGQFAMFDAKGSHELADTSFVAITER